MILQDAIIAHTQLPQHIDSRGGSRHGPFLKDGQKMSTIFPFGEKIADSIKPTVFYNIFSNSMTTPKE